MSRRSAKLADVILSACQAMSTARTWCSTLRNWAKPRKRFPSRRNDHQLTVTKMFLRLVADSFTRRPRRKLLTGAALALGMAVATAALSVSLDVGDRLAGEFRSLGANLVVTPRADSLPLEIGGVDYRPANSGTYLPVADLPKLKSIYWHNNIIAFAPEQRFSVDIARQDSPTSKLSDRSEATLIGTWISHPVVLSDGTTF